ncbi:hypothetical protein OIU34_18120 [Pararhizobium sp. BT-229]|uniref:hypothetical protein n=1 Tax=Pararhizobium sp. BT-229 TaxID=2986923 RepID=UPI0021F79BEC|nr:hypothetical protein [Pararhizobium sp. BT-229]MCV9963796.1 hypothetical protein [Pararhizobium sp. BT-229]
MSNTHPNPTINNLLGKFLDADFDTFGWKAGDWLVAIATLAVGVWYSWTLWIVVGVFAGFAAWWRPLTRMQNLSRSILRRASARRA